MGVTYSVPFYQCATALYKAAAYIRNKYHLPSNEVIFPNIESEFNIQVELLNDYTKVPAEYNIIFPSQHDYVMFMLKWA